MRHIFIGISLIISTVAAAQQIRIEGKVTEKRYGEPIYDAHVYVGSEQVGALTDAKGRYSFYFFYTGQTTITCSYTGYEAQEIVLDDNLMQQARNGTLKLDFEMERSLTIIDIPIVVTDLPDTIYGTQQHSVSDYEFHGSDYVLLTYEKRLKKGSDLLLVNSLMQIQDTYHVPYTAVGLERDFAGNIVLVCEDRVYEVQVNDNEFTLLKVDKQDYEELITPIVDTTDGEIFFSTWTDQFPAFDYNSYEIADSTINLIRQVADKFMLELCRAEYKYLDGYWKNVFFNWEVRTGIDKEVYACMATFENGLYYDPLYAPMFVVNDTILLFDHYESTLFKYQSDRTPIDSLPIDYHAPEIEVGNEFEQRLVVDEEQSQVYAIYQRAGGLCYLKRIDLYTGEVASEHELTFDYPTEIQVRNGFAYYIYRPFESVQKKYLYRERLN